MTDSSTPPIPLLQMRDISKSFPGVHALRSVNIEVFAGECLGLMGENGAGKSTLMKILSGVFSPDEGQVIINGSPVQVANPHHAQQLGVSIIYQEFNLFPNLSVAENIFIGREPSWGGILRAGDVRRAAQAILNDLGVRLNPRSLVRDLSVAQQQMVEIAKALSYNARIVIMDEPTSALSQAEVTSLFSIIRELKKRGLGVIFISHRLEEVFSICDRIKVLRDGQNAGESPVATTNSSAVVQMMVGRPLADLFHKEETVTSDHIMLDVRDLGRQATKQDASAITLHDVNFQVGAGEIVGLAGLVGSGRTEMARMIFGADRRDSGHILVDGKRASIKTPRDAIRSGIGLVPEDRKLQALILQLAVRENISLASLGEVSRAGFVRLPAERQLARTFIDLLQIRTPSLDQKVMNLSGGNQQKVVLAKWLALQPKVLLVDEPTRGVDIGAKAEVHSLLNQLARRGVAILMISSELPEILGMSDRILVVREGTIAGELSRREATQEVIMTLATGIETNDSAA